MSTVSSIMDATDHRPGRRRISPLVAASVAVTVVILLSWWVGADGWPGAPSGCIAAGDCSCEGFSGGLVVQPVNTFSSLAFVVAGIFVLRFAGDRLLGLVYGALVLFLGVGSAAFHASMTEWGGWLDLVAIHWLVGFVVAVDLATVLDRPAATSIRWFAGGAVVTAPALWFVDKGLGKYTAAVLVIFAAALEWRIARRETGRDHRWLGVTVVLFAAGLALQWLGRGGGMWCDPESIWQVHALWHVAAAAGAVALGRYLIPVAHRRRPFPHRSRPGRSM